MHKIDVDECQFCGACKSACPIGAITNPDGKNYYEISSSCVDCGSCDSECGFGAITTV